MSDFCVCDDRALDWDSEGSTQLLGDPRFPSNMLTSMLLFSKRVTVSRLKVNWACSKASRLLRDDFLSLQSRRRSSICRRGGVAEYLLVTHQELMTMNRKG